jgi:hypothetical protein
MGNSDVGVFTLANFMRRLVRWATTAFCFADEKLALIKTLILLLKQGIEILKISKCKNHDNLKLHLTPLNNTQG